MYRDGHKTLFARSAAKHAMPQAVMMLFTPRLLPQLHPH
jgi:hypothetical protein